MRGFDDFREALDAVETSEGLDASLERAAEALGFQHFVYYRMRSPDGDSGAKAISYPASWIAYYDDQGYQRVDPILYESCRTVAPISWASLTARYADDRAVMGFFKEAESVGLACGVSIPLYGPRNSLDIVSFCAPLEPQREAGCDPIDVPSCHLVGAFLHQTMERLDPVEGRAIVHLTPREREVLLWTAQGKTAWEIGGILDIAELTAVFHLKNACKKFGVFSKHQAVVKALMLGLINP